MKFLLDLIMIDYDLKHVIRGIFQFKRHSTFTCKKNQAEKIFNLLQSMNHKELQKMELLRLLYP